MTALSVLLVGIILIVANSFAATVRMLVHIGIFQSLITTAAKKARERKDLPPSPSWVEKDPNTLVTEAWIQNYIEEMGRLGRLNATTSTKISEGMNRNLRRRTFEAMERNESVNKALGRP